MSGFEEYHDRIYNIYFTNNICTYLRVIKTRSEKIFALQNLFKCPGGILGEVQQMFVLQLLLLISNCDLIL